MDTIETIMKRKSVRDYTGKPISDEDVRTILKAGMSGPTATNARPWSFIVVRDRETLCRMADANGGAAKPLKNAQLGILICGDLDRAFSKAPEFWIIDGAIAGQNMTLAAEALGIGSVWLGTWPQMEKVEAQTKLFDLPENIIPHSIIAFGYPQENGEIEASRPKRVKPEWEEDRIHFGKW
ncbi:MAG: nitroreductase family protein [Oscillospiraceae bacterium]